MSITLHRTVLALAFVASLVSISTIAPKSAAAATCSFTTDLTLGVESEQVRCLQQYLNANGFTVAQTGVGSQGSETTQFREKTQAAVMKWQAANGISPATGTFGPLSRAKYSLLMLTDSLPPVTPSIPAPTVPSVPSPVTDPEEEAALDALRQAREAYEDGQDEYEAAIDDDEEVGGSKALLADSLEYLLEAFFAFVDEDYSQALSSAREAEDAADESVDAIGDDSDSGDSDEGDAEDAIEDAEDVIDEAEEAIEEADDDGEDVDEAEDLLEEAEDALEEAEEAFDDEDYDDAVEAAEDAQDLAEEAIDAL